MPANLPFNFRGIFNLVCCSCNILVLKMSLLASLTHSLVKTFAFTHLLHNKKYVPLPLRSKQPTLLATGKRLKEVQSSDGLDFFPFLF